MENSTYYHWKSDKIFWKVKWIFPEAEMFSIIDEKQVLNKIKLYSKSTALLYYIFILYYYLLYFLHSF